ncbi:hypothetical protein A3SI_19601 [Nitritalea halalkaliphila LW7]|uniref:Uncharacterized protein n=1 Tax=Nitritalea halalkaliphila LW7 TaxID=1189621 RepID=I5BSN4_9BACT|nr:hypothetical protein [Nitritalea halalkaliphila]EIM72586.1 hypothetical protein A3SI_19601 [Nitritalea halalkaliphila LW7]
METYQVFIGAGFITWTFFSIRFINTLYKTKRTTSVNPYIYDAIPSVFTTLGVLGTFLGIYIGLRSFDVEDINTSIPILLDG